MHAAWIMLHNLIGLKDVFTSQKLFWEASDYQSLWEYEW